MIVQQPKPSVGASPIATPKPATSMPAAAATKPVATTPSSYSTASSSSASTAGADGKRGLSLIEKLKLKQQAAAAELAKKVTREPVLEEVQTLWNNYTEQLKADLKHSAVTSFNIAKLRVEGTKIIATSVTTINQKFLELEATNLLEIFKDHFFNMDITFEMEVVEIAEDNQRQLEARYLSGQDRFRLMATEYPLVKVLREKLRLEIAY